MRATVSGATAARAMRPLAVGLLLLTFAAGLRAEVVESFDLDTYEVDQDDDETLLQAINAESPIRQRGQIFHGFTKWFIRWNYRWWEDDNGTCRITEVTTTLDIDMILPELDDATPEAAAEFRRYIRNLRLHEDGHRDIARAAAEKIDAGIRRLPSMASCDALSRAANQFGQGVLAETRVIERQYDVSTEHGCTQGACL